MKIKIWIICLALTLCSCTKHYSADDQTVRLALKDAVRSADPARSFDNVSVEVVYQIYETLYQYDYFSKNLDIIPNLADGMPKVSADGKTYTIKIKKGIRYQDDPGFLETNGRGREVTADDFVYAWNRHADPKVKSQGTWIFEDKVVGYKQGSPYATAGFTVVDLHTLQIKLAKPYPQLMHILTMHFTSPLPKEVVDYYGKDFNIHPIGTGPFRASFWNPTSKILLVKNENFREAFFPNTDRKLPLVNALEFTVLKEEQPRWLGFLKGTFDQIEIPKDNFDTAMKTLTEESDELQKKGIHVSIEPSFNFWNIYFNMSDPILGKNKLLRQALASTIDTKGWLKLFHNGRGIIQTEVSPPSLSERCGEPYRWPLNLKKAEELLVQAGYPHGEGLPVFKFDTRTTDNSERQLAEFIKKNLAKIGVQLEISVNTFPAYLDKTRKGNLQITKGSWFMDYPDPENTYQLLYGPNKAPGPNVARFENSKYNRLYEKMARLKSGPDRKKIICQMEELIQEEMPWAYGIHENKYRLIQKRLKNYHTAEFIHNKYKYVEVIKN